MDIRSKGWSQLTIPAHLKIDDIANAHIDHTQETLVLLLEFLLVEDLNRKNTVLIDSAVPIPR